MANDAISNATLVIGDDPSRVYQTLEEHIQNIEDITGDKLEKVTYQSGESQVTEVIMAWQQNFIFSSRALIVLRDPGDLLAEDVDALIAAIDSYSGVNYLVLVGFSGKIDARLKAMLSKRRAVIDCSLGSKKEKTGFFGETVHKSGLRFEPDAYKRLVDYFGEDVGGVIPFLELLKASIGHRASIDRESLEPFLTSPGDVAPWDLTDAIEAGQVEKSLELLHRMIDAGGKHPLQVLSVLQRRFTDLAAISSSETRTPQQVRETLKARYKSFNRPDFVLDKMIGTARRIGYHRLARSFELLSMADRQVKGEGGLSPELAMEMLVGRLAHLMQSR